MAVLTSERVVQAGVEAVQELGLQTLSLRSLAERLGVTPMALYRHVDGAAALEAAVIQKILSAVEAPPADAEWEEAARTWALSARDVFAAHPGVSRHVLTSWFGMPRVLDWLEGLLAAAERAGLRASSAVAAVNAIFTYVLMRSEAEEAIRRARVMERKLPGGARSRARWPHLTQNAAEYEVARLDVHFHYGLEVLLSGIERRKRARS